MIDRIEELLAVLAAENEDEEREDVPTLTAAEEAVPASLRGDGGETGDGGTEDEWTAGEIVRSRSGRITGGIEDSGAGDKSGGRATGEIALERLGPVAGEAGDGGTENRSGGRTAGEIAAKRSGPIAGETAVEKMGTAGGLWKDGPVWTVQSIKPETVGTQRTEAAEQTVRAGEVFQPARDGEPAWAGLERAVRGGTAGLALESVGRLGLARAGLEGLYRQTVQGLRPAAPALPPERAGRTARAQELGSAASLAVDELDRAVRRDSRRYDGGMSIY